MKDLKNYLVTESNKNINVEITPENFDKYKFSDKQSALISHLLKTYKPNQTWIYLVEGNKPSHDTNIEQYFGTIIPSDERGILYIERQSTKMDSPEKVIFYDTSKIKEKEEKKTYIYSYHTESNSKFKSVILTIDEKNNRKITLDEKNIIH